MNQENKTISISLVLLSIIAVGAVLYFLKPLLIPLLIALMLSYILSPLVERLAKYKVPRLVTLLVLFFIGIGLLSSLLEVVLENVFSFVGLLPDYSSQFLSLIDQYTLEYPWLEETTSRFVETILSFPYATYANTLLNSSLTFASNTFLVLLFVTYFCLAASTLPQKISRAFPGPKGAKLKKVIDDINNDVRRYVSIHTMISMGTGFSVGLICWFFGVPFYFLWGFIAFLLNYIPTIGSIISSIPPIITALIVLNLSSALWIAVLITGVQTIWGNVIEPKIAGDRLGISPLFILLFLVFWGWIWGIVGAILAVPIASIIKISCLNIPALKPISVLMDDK